MKKNKDFLVARKEELGYLPDSVFPGLLSQCISVKYLTRNTQNNLLFCVLRVCVLCVTCLIRPRDSKGGFDMGMGHCKTESEWTPDFIFPEVVLYFGYLSL